MIDTPFISQASESHVYNRLMESKVPDPACLFHAIKAFVEAPDPVFFTRFFEARGLLDENSFRFREDPVEESSFNIEVLYIPVKDSSDVHKCTE